MAIVVAIAILLMELLYTTLAVRLTVGQHFKLYYDENISVKGTSFDDSLRFNYDDSVFSYDVLKFSSEQLKTNFNILNERLAIHEGDIIITDNVKLEGTKYGSRANELIDNNYICSIDKLKEDAEKYIRQFLLNSEGEISKENLDAKRIGEYFLIRQKGDNRFRTEKEKENGKQLEVERLSKFCDDFNYFNKAYEYGKNKGWFYEYKKYSYSLEQNEGEEDYSIIEDLNNKETNKPYALRVGNITGGNHSAEEYFKVGAIDSVDEVLLMVFDFEKQQPDLQFESIAVINRLIENCAGFTSINDIPTV